MMKAIRVLVVVIAVLTPAAAMILQAAPYEACEYTYYTDASKTTQCGFYGQYCTHSSYWGCRTPYYFVECFEQCGSNPPPGADTEPRYDGSACNDGMDNDGDGAVDCFDPGCGCSPS